MPDPKRPPVIEVIDDATVAMLQAKTPAERMLMVSEAHRTVRVLMAAGERLRHPDWTEAEIARAVAERLLHGTD